MKDSRTLISAAVTSLLALGVATASMSASAANEEQCFGISKAGQNACNSNANQHSCAGHSKIKNDPNDYKLVPQGSCEKMGGKLKPASSESRASGK